MAGVRLGRSRRAVAGVVLVAGLAGALTAGGSGRTAHAHTAVPVAPFTSPPTPDELAAYEFESSIIGPDHAAEHLRMAEQADAQAKAAQATDTRPFDPCRPRGPANQYESRPLPPAGRPTGQVRCSKLPPQPHTAAALARVGRWSAKDVSDLPHYAIHAALMPTGRVLFWGFEWTQNLITRDPVSHQDTTSAATVWDPAKGFGPRAFTPVPSPMIDVDGDGIPEHVPLYCSGQSFLPDGRVLVTGGTLDLRWAQRGYTAPPGLRTVLVFDPRTQTWARQQDMTVARWYPNQVELADGRTLVLGGFDDQKPTNLTATLDLISRDGHHVSHQQPGDRATFTYPGMLLMPSGNVLLAGPLTQDSGLLDPKTMTWGPLPPLPGSRSGSNLVPVPTRSGTSPTAMLIGGTDALNRFALGPDQPGYGAPSTAKAYKTTLVWDEAHGAAGWRHAPSENAPRNWPNTVLLPDGSMVTVGGGSEINAADGAYANTPAQRHVELWDPATRRWRVGPEQREARTYHSVALLLPDGRVWSAGDDANPNRDGDTAEVYEPPYLFKGARPRIVAGPRAIRPGARFTLDVTGSAPARVTMLAPSAVTHARDMNQRFVELKVLRRERRGSRTRLVVRGPVSHAAAPPGPWMLFALSRRGAASVARWTSVR